MRGTGYAVTEIILWMVAAGLVGLAIGWILRSFVGGGARLAESEAKLEKEQERYAQISGELGEWKRKIGNLSKKLEGKDAELGSARELNAQLEEDLITVRADMVGLEKLGAELSQLRADHAGCGVSSDEQRGTIAGLESRIEAGNIEIQRLESELSAARSGGAATSHESPALFAAESVEPVAPGWQQGVTTLGTPGDTHQDDLRVINGVGKKLQKVLNGFGIQSWEQVAALTPDEVARVDDAIDFPGRVERDGWVEQAADLIARFPDREDRPTRETFLNDSPE